MQQCKANNKEGCGYTYITANIVSQTSPLNDKIKLVNGFTFAYPQVPSYMGSTNDVAAQSQCHTIMHSAKTIMPSSYIKQTTELACAA